MEEDKNFRNLLSEKKKYHLVHLCNIDEKHVIQTSSLTDKDRCMSNLAPAHMSKINAGYTVSKAYIIPKQISESNLFFQDSNSTMKTFYKMTKSH